MRLTSENTPDSFDALDRIIYRAPPVLGAVALLGSGLWFFATGKPGGWLLLLFGGVLAVVAILAFVLSTTRAHRRVTIDVERREVIFEHYEVMHGFWPARPVPRYVCAFGDVVGVEHTRSLRMWGPEWLIVHVPGGRIRINSYHTNYVSLSEALLTIAGPQRLPLTRRDAFPGTIGALVVLGAVLLAFAMGWLP